MQNKDIHWQADADVVVIGYGAAGAVAAITAHDCGSKVLILEKQESEKIITNSFMSDGGIINTNDRSGAIDYMEALVKVSDSISWTDREVIYAWARYTEENVAWLERIGGKPLKLYRHGGEHRLPGAEAIDSYHVPGLGPGLMNMLYRQVSARSIDVHYNSSATELLMTSQGEVMGVQARTTAEENKAIKIKVRRAVILTTGGFEFDEQMKLQYLRVYPSYFLGSPANTGDGIRLALRAGAQLWHMNCCSARLVMKFPELPFAFNPAYSGKNRPSLAVTEGAETKASRADEAGFIIVDRSGRRYTKETIKPHTLYYELAGFDSQKLFYPRVPSYWIFDHRRIGNSPLVRTTNGPAGPARFYRWSANNNEEIERGWVKQCDTVKGLGMAIGVDGKTLAQTVRNYNRFCQEGRDEGFGRQRETLIPLDSPPYYAVELWPGGPNTQGGPRRNGYAQIVRPDGTPIPRLYSAGELGSIYGMLYPSGGGNLAECVAFGRIAGEHASAERPR